MRRTLAPLAILAIAVLILIYNVFFIVPTKRQALVVEFGRITRVITEPGLYVKAPFVQSVVVYDARNLGLDLKPPQTIIAADQEQLVVDAYARWRITDPVTFYRAVQSEQVATDRMGTVMRGALRRVLGSAQLNDIISGRRAELMQEIRRQMNVEASKWGIAIVDIRIRQADFPAETSTRVYERMRTERQQVAAQLRAEGDEEAAEIRAKADRDATVALAVAREQSEKIRGDGDAKRAAIFAQAYGRDAEFAAFYRSLQAYEKAMPRGTQMVIPPEGEFFRYLNRKGGQ
ncbi:MAG: protease modulator HflC [Hyphomonadaceae bacterium]